MARRGAKFGMEAPTIIKMEQEIDREMMIDAGESVSSEDDHIYEPEVQRQKVAADFKSLDEMVRMVENALLAENDRLRRLLNGHLNCISIKQL